MDIVKLMSVLPSVIRGIADPMHRYSHDEFGSLCTKTEETVLSRLIRIDKLDAEACGVICSEEKIDSDVVRTEIIKLDSSVVNRLTRECASAGFQIDGGLLFIAYVAKVKDHIEQAKFAEATLDAPDILKAISSKQGASGPRSSPLRSSKVFFPQKVLPSHMHKYDGRTDITQEKIFDLVTAIKRANLLDQILTNLYSLYIHQYSSWIPKSILKQVKENANEIARGLSPEIRERMIADAITGILIADCNLKILNPEEVTGAYWTLYPIMPSESHIAVISMYEKCDLTRAQGDMIIATISIALYAQFCDLVENSPIDDILEILQ